MSHLRSTFEQRQVARRAPSVSGTVSSYDADSLIFRAFPPGELNERPADIGYVDSGSSDSQPKQTIYNLDNCTEVRIGENVTKIYGSSMYGKWRLYSLKNLSALW